VNNTEISNPEGDARGRVLEAGEARTLMAEGWAAADLHVHTLHSYDVIPTRVVDPLTLYFRARQMGMTYVTFTDHDTMDAYDRIGWTREGLIPGVEVKILDSKRVGHTVHINVYTLNRNQFAEISRITRSARDLGTLFAYLKGEHLPFSFNHPFWHEPGEKPNLRAVIEIAEEFPVLEYNMGRIGRLNHKALQLAQAKGKGILAATDSHVGDIGGAFTVARGRTFGEFFDQIRDRRSFIVPADLTLSRLKKETAIRIRYLFDKAGWLFPKEFLTLETGSAILDGIISRQAQSPSEPPRLSNRILRKILEAVSKSGIPGSLYLRDQHNLANEVGRLLDGVQTAA
jgi:predicted metal-dependent phosphoesterase TrpH